jgi:hypothetical protein
MNIRMLMLSASPEEEQRQSNGDTDLAIAWAQPLRSATPHRTHIVLDCSMKRVHDKASLTAA